jgi:hypothetical protein
LLNSIGGLCFSFHISNFKTRKTFAPVISGLANLKEKERKPKE